MTPIDARALCLPAAIARLLGNAPLFAENAGRSAAKVFFSPTHGGMYLKIGAPGSLENAARMQAFFHGHGLSSPLEAYERAESDFLLVGRVPGESGIHPRHLEKPARLAAVLGEAARLLHETPAADCPVRDFSRRLQAQVQALRRGNNRLVPHIAESLRVSTPESALREMETLPFPADGNALVHGDLCLPNCMLDGFRFSGFIDLGEGGVGERNYDLFWTTWSLSYNLGGDGFQETFFDAYGRDAVDEGKMRFFALLNCLEPA